MTNDVPWNPPLRNVEIASAPGAPGSPVRTRATDFGLKMPSSDAAFSNNTRFDSFRRTTSEPPDMIDSLREREQRNTPLVIVESPSVYPTFVPFHAMGKCKPHSCWP